MSKNPKGTITLAFVFTFLLGMGAGYLLCTNFHRAYDTQYATDAFQNNVAERHTPYAPSNGSDPEIPGPPRERRGDGEGTRRSDATGMSGEERTGINRFRQRLIRDLDLSEAVADQFFTLLETYRRQVRREVILPQRALQQRLQQRHSELDEQLEQELATILSDAQMDLWRERYAPRPGRRAGQDPARGTRRTDSDDGTRPRDFDD